MARVSRAKIMKQNKLVLASVAIGIFFVIFYSKTVVHVVKEFYSHNNFNIKLCNRFHSITEERTNEQIPKLIHQIFFNLSDNRVEFWKKFRPYQQTWIQKNPDHQYILWNASMIEELLNKSYPSVKPLYNRYQSNWVVRADIARYLVVHHMGGVYADLDVMCKRSMNELYHQKGDKSVVLNYTLNPFGISNDFFMAAKNHEFMAHVIDGLEEADVFYLTPYVNTMFRTGPMFMLGRYLNYPHQEDIYLIPQASIHAFIDSTIHGQSWYNVDGQFIAIVWNGVSPIQVLSLILMIVFIVRLCKLIRIRRNLIKRSYRQVRFYQPHQKYVIPEDDTV